MGSEIGHTESGDYLKVDTPFGGPRGKNIRKVDILLILRLISHTFTLQNSKRQQ